MSDGGSHALLVRRTAYESWLAQYVDRIAAREYNSLVNQHNERMTKTDIARHAGVSHQTVTRVLTGSTAVRPETRKKVLEVCRQFGYMPNLIARSLKSGKTNVLGLIVPTVSHSYFGRITASIEKAASSKGYLVLLAQSQSDQALSYESLMSLFGMRVDGFFWAAQECATDIYEHLRVGTMPVVFLDQPAPDEQATFVGVDDLEGGYEAVSHLISLGHRRIAHIAGAPSYTAQQRMRGYLKAMQENNIDCGDEDIFESDYDLQSGYDATDSLLRSGRRYTAVFCANDYIAIGALSCLHDKGMSVPGDLSVIGFAGDIIGKYCIPPLTTIHQPAEELGVAAVECMMAMIEGRPYEKRELLKARLLAKLRLKPTSRL